MACTDDQSSVATTSCTVRVSKIPYTAFAQELADYLNEVIGSNSVFACKIHTERPNWKSKGFGFVQFETGANASKAVELARRCQLGFQHGRLQVEMEQRQIVDRPQIRLQCKSFHMGCLESMDTFCTLWSVKTRVTLELDRFKEKLTLFLDADSHGTEYKLTWKLPSLEIYGPQKPKELFLLLKGTYAPKIHWKSVRNGMKRGRESSSDRYTFFRESAEDEEHAWQRSTDLSDSHTLERSSSYYLEISSSEAPSYDNIVKMLSELKAFHELDNIFVETQCTMKDSERETKEHFAPPNLKKGLVQVHRLLITPSKVYRLDPSIEVSNRVVRHHMGCMEDFLRVQFTDEDMTALSYRALGVCPDKSFKTQAMPGIYRRICGILNNGIVVGGKRFEFLAFSSSQLREHSLWMFASTPTLTANNIRVWMGDFTSFKNVASCAARMGQCFSASKEGPPVYVYEVEEISDIEANYGGVHYVFSDGIGKISLAFAAEVARKCGYKGTGREAPSAFQVRYSGYKGVVAIDPSSTHKLSLRPSMKKFESKLLDLDILEWSRFLPCYLNRQVITLLSTLGVKDCVFEEMQRERIASLDEVLEDKDAAFKMLQTSCGGESHKVMVEMLMAGYHPSHEPFLFSMLQAFKLCQLRKICEKSKIFVPNGRVLMGCLDETAFLDYGQVFVKVSVPAATTHNSEFVVQGTVVVAKNPCLHPGDVRVLQAVDAPNLHHMVDCIVFPQKGKRPHPNECSGSDLDGDLYFVTWDERLIPPTVEAPMDYIRPNTISLDHPPSLEEIQRYFVNYMSNDSLGTIANAHVVFADREPEKARSWQCKELAELSSTAVDFPKTGVAAMLPKYLRPSCYPDFMEKSGKKSYISSGILGKLYRAAREAIPMQRGFFQFYDKELIYKGFEEQVEQALVYKKMYDERLMALMELYGVQTEAELLSGFLGQLQLNRNNRSKKVEERLEVMVASLQQEAQGWLHDGIQSGTDDGHASTQEYAKASAWYHVTYHHDFCKDGGSREGLLSFPWVNYEKLLTIKRFNRLVKDT